MSDQYGRGGITQTPAQIAAAQAAKEAADEKAASDSAAWTAAHPDELNSSGGSWQGAINNLNEAYNTTQRDKRAAYGAGSEYAKQATDWLNTGGSSGRIASQGASQAAGASGGTARSLGMNAAQAAKQGGQQGAQTYGNLYNNAYNTGAGTLANLSGSYNQVGIGNTQAGIGALQTAAGQQGNIQQASSAQQGALIGGIASAVQAAIPALNTAIQSDETKKRDIKPISNGGDFLNAVFSKVKPYQYKYKDSSVAADGGQEHAGVMAQDLEKTPLKGAVMDTPNGKMVDPGQMTMGNTAMIGELNEKMNKLMNYMKAGRK